MKYIYLNLKRFDIPREYGGVNSLAPIREWGSFIVENIQDRLDKFDSSEVKFTAYFPEAHLIHALNSIKKDKNLKIGSQAVFRENTAVNGNFGAFTTNMPANSAVCLGCTDTIIGHCEERIDKIQIMQEAGNGDTTAVNRILNKEIKNAIAAGLSVLYCIGESSEEQERWKEVLGEQLALGLEDVDTSKIVIGYEPIWSIGPGKIPAGKEYIQKIAKFIKEKTKGIPVVYGGGLKNDNAKMLASIPEIDGGLIALTRFKGDIGFYPDEYIEIIENYLSK